MTKKYNCDEKNLEALSHLIKKLTQMDGVSSDEISVSLSLKKILEKYCDYTEVDKFGNVIAMINKDTNAKTLMFEAHMDRIGLMVSDISDDGLIEFTNIGGVDERILPSSEVYILGKEKVAGVIFEYNKSDKKSAEVKDLRIKTFLSECDIKKFVSVGDMIVVSSDFTKLRNNQFSSGAMDNRAGIASVINAVSKLNREKIKYNIAILFSVQEELGLHGAYTGGNSLKCDAAIVVDVTHGATHDSKDETGVFPLGSGAVICRGSNFDYKYTLQLIEKAREYEIPYDIEVASGPSGTSAWALQITAGGIPSLLVSIPLKYMHTNVETLDICDIDAVSSLLVVAAEGGIEID